MGMGRGMVMRSLGEVKVTLKKSLYLQKKNNSLTYHT